MMTSSVEPYHGELDVQAVCLREPFEATRSSTSRKIADIELLRGIAVLFIIFHHAHTDLFIWRNEVLDGLFQYFQFWTGVDLFFAISGFVIARSLLPVLNACRSNTAFFRATLSFWIRRAWRLLPSAWLWLALLLLAPLVFHSGAFGSVNANFWAMVAGVLDFANFRFAAKFMHGEYGTSFVYWSLSLEEQFYLLLPIATFMFRRWLVFPLAFLLLLQLFTPRTTTLLMVVRTDAIILGVLLAMGTRYGIYRLIEPRGLADSRLLRIFVVSLLLGGTAALGASKLPINIGLIAVLSAILVLIASYDRDYLCRQSLAKKAMIWIGSRSYGLYLIHVPAFCLTREIWYRLSPTGTVFDRGYTVPFALSAAFLLLLLSELNYRYVEAPFRAYGANASARLMKRSILN